MGTTNALPAGCAPGWTEFLRERLGARWVIATRLTDRLRRSGYERAVTRAQYQALEREWEVLTYGAPLASLQAAAPALLAALRTARDFLDSELGWQGSNAPDDLRAAYEATETAINAAEGRA